jgi:hypothetical protein
MYLKINFQLAIIRASSLFQKIIQSEAIRFEDLKALCIHLKKYKYYKATIIQILVDLYSKYDPYTNMCIFSLEKNVNDAKEVQKNLSLILNIININNITNDQSVKFYSRILIKNMLMLIIYIYGACNNSNPIIISSYYSNQTIYQIICEFYNRFYLSSLNDEFINCLLEDFAGPLISHIRYFITNN